MRCYCCFQFDLVEAIAQEQKINSPSFPSSSQYLFVEENVKIDARVIRRYDYSVGQVIEGEIKEKILYLALHQ